MPVSTDLSTLAITKTNGVVNISNPYLKPQVVLDIPTLAKVLAAYNGITDLGNKVYRINVPLYISDNIRLQITGDTVSLLELKSGKNFDITTLTLRSSEGIIKNTTITSIDPETNQPDTDISDGRSFVRAYENTRMDVLDSKISNLGMTLSQIRDPQIAQKIPYITQGAVYGISWRIGTGTYGQEIVTGWIDNSTFENNYIGAYTFGAQGMMWSNSTFQHNTLYGLDPHDDSNNALVENNKFLYNGKHGFIVSKRCRYNIIRGNISVGNHLHGFMLHADSDYNLIEDNTAIANVDNYVVYGSSFNTIRNNKGFDASSSNVRINSDTTLGSYQNYITHNSFDKGKYGVFLYGINNGVFIANNTFVGVGTQLRTRNDTSRVLYADNTTQQIDYDIGKNNRVAFGVNHLQPKIQLDTAILTKYKLPR